MWNRDEIRGKTDQAKGRAKEAVGDLSNDDRLRDEGSADEMQGNVEETLGKGRRKVGEAIEDIGEDIKR
jgi:uncharacterized protein YjbJ (UPF0337 family)